MNPSITPSPGNTPTPTPGRTPNGALSNVRPPLRKKKPANPLVQPKKRPTPQSAPRTNGISQQQRPNGHRPSSLSSQPPQEPPQNMTVPVNLARTSQNLHSGFSAPNIGPFRDYPLVLSKRQVMENYRLHVARFASRKNIDPTDKEEFVRPVRLHRRDPRLNKAPDGEDVKAENGEDSKEAEKKAIEKARRDHEREIENAKVAPTSGIKNRGPKVRKTEQVFNADMTEEQKARAKLRYEEAIPWQLEDFDGKCVWTGGYEDALSNTYGMLVLGQDGIMRMTPLEKWYKFTEKKNVKIQTMDEAEAIMKKRVKEPKWFLDSQAAHKRREEELANERSIQYTLFRGKPGAEVEAKPQAVKNEAAEADDLDFVEDRFADDEENMVFEEDVDKDDKDTTERIKKDQLQANIFDLKEEKEYEKEAQVEKREEEQRKTLGKKVKKALKKREKNFIYDSDSDPDRARYGSEESSDSESDSTDTERRKAEEKAAKEKEALANPNGVRTTPDGKLAAKPNNTSKSSKPSSGRATPSHRPSKHGGSADPTLSRVASSSNLKRPNSSIDTDASGNESSRSRKKAKKAAAAVAASGLSNSLQPGSRPASPPIVGAGVIQQGKKRRAGAGSGSDTEPGSGSDGAGRKKQKLKLRLGSQSLEGSPVGSRAGSPVAGGAAPSSQGIPMVAATPPPPLPTVEQIKSKIPAQGISMADLLKEFPGLMNTPERKAQFQGLLKVATRFDKVRRVLLPL